jgi:hypothetical protein
MTLILAIALLFSFSPPLTPYAVTCAGNCGASPYGSMPLERNGPAIYQIYTARNLMQNGTITALFPRACVARKLTITTGEIGVEGGDVVISFRYRGKVQPVLYSARLKANSSQTFDAPPFTAVIIDNAAEMQPLYNNRSLVYFTAIRCGK